MKKIIHITGMSCKHCQMRVTNLLQNLPQVKTATVSLELNTATIELNSFLSDQTIIEQIEAIGYDVTNIINEE
ncbi:MAG: heavy metal-associated domain-containing protein [Bacilli bacterium]|nr:heavy metal-associated domain-containing protein [Bacilli bacterium]MDY0063835.1 heavy metal-associated domain-containing protein [Bacilli bacterium]